MVPGAHLSRGPRTAGNGVIKTAFVLGAGLGTRLRPLTEVRPKPLVPVCLRPLVEYGFDHLHDCGVERFVINTHWLPEVWERDYPGGICARGTIHFRHEPDILETAGGMKNVEDLLGDGTFIVYNGDIMTDLPLAAAIGEHRSKQNEVTMVLRSRDEPRQVVLDPASGRVADIGGKLGAPGPAYLFTGVYLVEPAFLARIPPREKIGVVKIFLEMIRTGAKLGGVVIDEGHWWDLGTREKYLEVHRHFASNGGAPWISRDAEMGQDVQVLGASAIGAGARIGAGTRLVDSVIWPGAVVAAGSELQRCVVTGRAAVNGRHVDADL
jgi:mannose-1-phosphate guanylyltransferase